MQVFEFHFNPGAENELIFNSFCYEPENIYEKRLGGLYVLGLLKHPLPQNVRFLDNLTRAIKEKYYKTSCAAPEKSLKEALRKANELLEKIAKGNGEFGSSLSATLGSVDVRAGDVSWLGNLSFAVITLKNYELNFTKIGDLKIFLLRRGQIIDIDQKIKFDEIEPYPLKIFGNIVSGKLAENDIILALTGDIATSFSQENLLGKISNISPFEPKRLKEIFNSKKEQLVKTSGVCLLIALTKETLPKKKETLVLQKTLKIFSLKKILSPLVKFLEPVKKIYLFSTLYLARALKISLAKKPVLKMPRMPEKLKLKIIAFLLKKNAILILSLLLLLILGFLIFRQ